MLEPHEYNYVTALITGFEPFAGAVSNASWAAVKNLPEQCELAGGTVKLAKKLLPVSFSGAAKIAHTLITEINPDIIIHVGLDAKTSVVKLETTACNEANAAIPDNDGAQPGGEQIVPGAAARLKATWDAHVLAGRLKAAGLPVAVSNDAGRYVCNATLYSTLDLIYRSAPSNEPIAVAMPLAGFVHVPTVNTLNSTTVTQTLLTLLTELADQVRRNRAWISNVGRLSVPRPQRAIRVGLTGGIGSGKTTVARMLAAHGAHVVDADAISHEVVQPGSAALASIKREFGSGVLTAAGQLDRAALAAIVFRDATARNRLENIILPHVACLAAYRMEQAGANEVAVYDVPLLVEKNMADLFDAVVVVEAPLEMRLARLAQRGLGREEACARIAQQVGDDERRQVADAIIINDGSQQNLRDGVSWLWENRFLNQLACG